MPEFPIIDAHLHLWDPRQIQIGWQAENDFLRRPFLTDQYASETDDLDVEAMVFVECFVDRGDYLNEVRFVEQCAKAEPRIKSIVAQASIDDGEDVRPFLRHLKEHHQRVVGIRRMIEFQPDPDFCLRPNFLRGLNMLAEFDLSFEINIHHSQFDKVLEMVPQVDGVTMILDHCAKPGIKSGEIARWSDHMHRLAQHKDVFCKLSDLPVEADWTTWREEEILPYIDVAVEAFGFERLIFAGDWPVCLQATSPKEWVALLDKHFAGVDPVSLRKFYAENARRVYKI